MTIGRARDGSRRGSVATISTISSLGEDPPGREATARDHLEILLDLFRRGMREPLPLYCTTTEAWAAAARRGQPCEQAAEKAWTTPYGNGFPHEDQDPEHGRVFGGVVGFEHVLAEAGEPRGDEAGDGWDCSETTRFGRYAHRLWDGLLDHEQLVDE